MSIRVAFVTNFITPYRVSFFSKMAALPGIKLLVVHGEVKKETGRPAAETGASWRFERRVVRNNEKRLGPFVIRWQSGVRSVLRSFRPDVVVVLGISGTISNWIMLIWGKIKRLRMLMWMCGWEAQDKATTAYRLKKILLKLFVKLPDTLLLYSSKAKDYMIELGVPPEKCVVCYNGLDLDESRQGEIGTKHKAVELRRELNPENVPVFLYVGGILPEKRVDLLLKAFAEIRSDHKAVLWIIGDGPAMPEIRDLAASLGAPDVRFLGRIIDQVDPYFAAADFFVLPGIGGLALNQALWWGTPCICSEADGTEADLVCDGKTGFCFSVNDGDSLVSALVRAVEIFNDKESYNSMVDEGRKLITSRSNTDEMIRTFSREFVEGHRS